MTSFRYCAYGLNIESDLACPEYWPSQGAPDVYIRYGPVPTALEGPRAQGVVCQAKPNQFLLQLDGIAAFLVSDGTEIVIDREPNSRDDELRLFLSASVFGALLLQRGRLVLNASAIETVHGAVLFIAPSGFGKSTLAGAFFRRGYRVLADDLCTIAFDEHGVPMVLPSFPQLKIWADTATVLDANIATLQRVRPQIAKYAMPVRERFVPTPVPLYAGYALATTNTQEFSLERLHAMENFQVVVANAYHRCLLAGLGVREGHFQQAVTVGQRGQFHRLTRPNQSARLEVLVDLVERDFT